MKYINTNEKDIQYKKRPGSYAIIIRKKDDKIGIVTDGNGNFYLGGGMEKGETEVETLKREVMEESGYTIKNIQEFDKVGSFLFSKTHGYLEVIAHVYIAELDEKIKDPIEKDYTMLWVNAEDYIGKMYKEWQEYILKEFIQKYRRDG